MTKRNKEILLLEVMAFVTLIPIVCIILGGITLILPTNILNAFDITRVEGLISIIVGVVLIYPVMDVQDKIGEEIDNLIKNEDED